MTKDQKIIRAKAGLLELAKQLGNVSEGLQNHDPREWVQTRRMECCCSLSLTSSGTTVRQNLGLVPEARCWRTRRAIADKFEAGISGLPVAVACYHRIQLHPTCKSLWSWSGVQRLPRIASTFAIGAQSCGSLFYASSVSCSA